MDTRMNLVMVCYSPDFEKKKPEFLEGLPDEMKLFSQFLGGAAFVCREQDHLRGFPCL
ncbi:Glutathione S-transferase [Heterocephalus glaber]|uniref:glutathione transferase n=1 Tax=Heterocephalus glaber TaxID=10181 RepID=G5C2A4_HETGA|nr:Glutathione S-transferase [Heterocephalus glaber]